jgi:ankyrin repeat protein
MMNSSPPGTEMQRRIMGMEPTDEEMLAMWKITHEHWKEQGGVFGRWREDRVPSEQLRAADEKLEKNLQELLGPDRYLDYQLATSGTGQQLKNFAAKYNIPRETVSAAFDLQKEIERLQNVETINARYGFPPGNVDAALQRTQKLQDLRKSWEPTCIRYGLRHANSKPSWSLNPEWPAIRLEKLVIKPSRAFSMRFAIVDSPAFFALHGIRANGVRSSEHRNCKVPDRPHHREIRVKDREEGPLMRQPEALRTDRPLKWSAGTGREVWAMFCACVAGETGTVRRLLEKDPSLARCQHAYRKPLYFAVRENRLEVAELLLGSDPNPSDLAVNDSLMQIAIDRGHVEMRALIERKLLERFGASQRGEQVAAAIRARDATEARRLLDEWPELLHAGDWRASQPIHWAVMTRQIELIDELLRRGADINARRMDGARPIHLANGDYFYRGWRDVPKEGTASPREVYQHLVERGAEVDLGMACATGDLERARKLVEGNRTQVNRASEYSSYYLGCGAPIKNAAAGGHLEIVRYLLEQGADPNLPEEGIAPDGHALYSAAANGHFEVARLLLEHGARPNAEVESSADTLSRVISNGDRKMLELLCTYGAARPVHLLAADNDLQTAAAVFAANPALAKDPEALANAAGGGHENFVRLMLRYEPELPKLLEFPAWSVGAKTAELNELLFAHGMEASAPDWLGITPLHQFARTGDLEKAKLFADHGADLHARDEDICSTPLGWAAKFNQMPMAKWLLERGSKTNLPDDPTWATPLAWAERRGHDEMARWLREKGAR